MASHYQDDYGDDQRISLSPDEKMSIFRLRRLLRCMHENEAPEHQSWQSLLLRAQHCQELWHTTVSQIPNLSLDLQAQLDQEVDHACRRAREVADQRRLAEQQSQGHVDVIQAIFFPPPKPDFDDDTQDELDDLIADDESDDSDQDGNDDAHQQHRRQSHRHSSEALPGDTREMTEQLQAQQREQMEEAIASMAAQMKVATQNIHSTLQAQTKGLDEMEQVVEQNVQDVTQVAQNVQDHNTRAWKSTIGTWTLLFTIVGIFVFTLLTIFTIPKRSDACLFFCSSKASSPASKVLMQEDPKQHWEELHQRDEEYQKLYEKSEEERLEKERLNKLLQDMQQQQKQERMQEQSSDDHHPSKKKVPSKDDLDWRLALNEEENDDDPTDPFAAHKPVDPDTMRNKEKDQDVEDEMDPFGAHKPVDPRDLRKNAMNHQKKNLQEAEDDEMDPFGAHKPVDPRKIRQLNEEDMDPFAGRKPVDSKAPKGFPQDDDEDDPTDPFAAFQPVDDEDGQVGRGQGSAAPKKELTSEERLKKLLESIEEEESIEPPKVDKEDVVDDLLASLNKLAAAEKTKKEEGATLPEIEELAKVQQGQKPKLSYNAAFDRSASAKKRFSPRDLRLAAANGDYDSVLEYIEMKPEYIDRVDKNGWGPIHNAVRSGDMSMIKLLVDNGCNVGIATNEGSSALAMAIERFGEEHAISRLLKEASNVQHDEL